MTRLSIPLLSKIRFTSGLQCHKRLFFSLYDPGLATPVGPALEGLFESVNRIGEIARGLRPGGTHVDDPVSDHERAAERTISLLADPEVPAIYEAAFTELDVRIRADILARTLGGGWDLIEVKLSTSAKSEHIASVGLQLLVLEESGLPIDRIYIAHVNRDYVYGGGEYVAEELLTLKDVTEDARAYADNIPAELAAMRSMLAEDDAPAIDLGPHCYKPYQCEFYEHCRGLEPDASIEELPRLSASARSRMRDAGIRSIHDIPADQELTPQQAKVRAVVQSGEPEFGTGLAGELERITTPAHFIDFETMNPVLPLYPGTRPYQVQAFQWSDHTIHTDGSLTHAEFLAGGNSDPRREFVETLLEQLRDARSVVAYSAYEATRLRDLRELYPDLSDPIEELLARPWVDLLQVVRGHVYHPGFRGSFSIQRVLPALVPEFSYGDLEIRGGDVASIAYLESVSDVSAERREQLRADLLAYCGRDTEAMVRIVEMLRMSSVDSATVAKSSLKILSWVGDRYERKWESGGEFGSLQRIANSVAAATDGLRVRRDSYPKDQSWPMLAILFTDLVSSTELIRRVGDEAAMLILRKHNSAVRRALEAHGGTEVKLTGDGIMASFPSAVGAVTAALRMQQDLAGDEILAKIGINAGEPVAEDNDLVGISVSKAARICELCEPGQVLVSNVVRELCEGKMVEFTRVIEVTLRGWTEPEALYDARVG